MFTVAFDGLSGAGKTTCTRKVIPELVDRGYRVVSVNEKELEPIKSWVVAWHERTETDKAFSRADVVEFANCRAVAHRELLCSDVDVLHFDRSVWTSAVYQRSAVCSAREVLEINIQSGSIIPMATFLFMADLAVCHERIMRRAMQKTDYALPAQVESLEQVEFSASGYEEIMGAIPRLHLVDGSKHPEQVAGEVGEKLLSYLG